uniref:Protein NO VEIN C-terminal domain-containing protein n=1 Tax=Peronospora matthiolae TaxID=2874970 RepID=A0AAV1UFX7_9STRA
MRQSHGGHGGSSKWQHVQQQQQQLPYHVEARAPVAPADAARVQRDVVAFIEAFRANQSHPAAPPNALTLDVVVRAVCSHFRVATFEDLMGTSALQLPALRQLHTVNQRVWMFVTCFMQSRRIHTLLECQHAFLQHEGLRSFHELKLGNSFLHTEAVQQLYHSPVVVMNITTKEVLGCLRQFGEMLGRDAFRSSSHIDLHEFGQYLAQTYRQPSAQAMGVAIDPSGFGVYVGMLRRIANHEMKEMKTLEQQLQREVAEKLFRITKEKFSDDNRQQALKELLEQTNGRSSQQENDEVSHHRRQGKKGSMQSLSLDMLKRVTDVDVYLDNVLRRKAAVDAKSQQKFCKPISSQEIAETDSKLRNQLSRFLTSSQKSRHHSRLKVVTWVICSIMAKTYALLLSDDKLPDDDGLDGGKSAAVDELESDKEECDCCCLGEDSCTCSCSCKCHVESSDDEGEDNDRQDNEAKMESNTSGNTDQFPAMPTDPFTKRYGKITLEEDVTLEDVQAEIESFSNIQQSRDNPPQTEKDVLLVLSSLENHLISKFSAKRSTITWAGRRSVLELLSHLLSDVGDESDESGFSAGRWLLGLMRSAVRNDRDNCPSKEMVGKKRLHHDVMPFVRECYATISSSSALSSLSSEKQQQWIAHRIRVALGCVRTEDCGLPSVEELTNLVDQDPCEVNSSVIKYAGSFDISLDVSVYDDAVAQEGATGESMRKLLAEQALEKLRKCPYLVDVSLYMDWQERYAPICGALLLFIRVHEMILLDHASSNNFLFVCCIDGTILRVNEKSTSSDLEMLFARAQAEQTPVAASQIAIHLVSILVTCKGHANFPKQLVKAHLCAHLSECAKGQTVDSYRQRFVVEVLMDTPVEFADFMTSLLFDVVRQGPSSDVLDDMAVADQIWKACQSDAERKMLVLISSRSLSPLWMEQTEKWCTRRENLTIVTVEDTSGDWSDDRGKGMTATESKSALPGHPSNVSNKADDIGVVCHLLDTFDSEAASQGFSDDRLDRNTVESEPSARDVASADSCRSFIDELRKKQFGVGLHIEDEAATSVLLIQQQRLERALKRLSDELYSESTHFVLELLQNADDNAYDDAVVPLGEFTVTADKHIVFYNNERGFSPENVRAICDVGASTKATTDSEASIGKKGIGFKSVFKVSDNPQVHSNGFHISFHAKNSQHGSGMGYILPYWMDDVTQWEQRCGTTFVLPLNSASVHRVDDISQSLMALEPSVLLFLRRIRELRLRDLTRQHTHHFLKKEKKLHRNTHIVLLLSRVKKDEESAKVAQQNWLVVKNELEPPLLFHRSHPTEIALALPISGQGVKLGGRIDRPPLQHVFAYLPLRSYGFRFILQGDFEIPSSREAITNGSEWNEWLVSKLPALVCAAVSSYISTIERDEECNAKLCAEQAISAISHLLSLLPLENEVQAPFRSIVPEVMRELRQVKWLAGASCDPCSLVVDLFMPSGLIDCAELTENDQASESMMTLLEALGEDTIASTLNKRFLHPALSRTMSISMKRQLRIEQLHTLHLMQVLSLSADKNDIDWTVAVLSLLAKLWQSDRQSHLRREELRLIKCFPLQQSGNKDSSIRWISLADGHDSLFVPGNQADDYGLTRDKSYEFYSDLRILDDRFTKAAFKSSKLRAFLINHVGIHVMEDHDLMRHHILPAMAMLRSPTELVNDGDLGKVDAGVVIQYGKFVSSHLESCINCPMHKDIKANMVVATTDGRVLAVDASNLFVVLPSTYESVSQLQPWITTKIEASSSDGNVFGIVSSGYFSGNGSTTDSCPTKTLDKRWRELLVDVNELSLLFDVASLLTDSRSQAGMKQLLGWIESEDDIALKRSMSKLLAELMDQLWRTQESDAGLDRSSCITTSGDESDDTFSWWRRYFWLEGSDGNFYRPIDLWMSVESVTHLFTPAMVAFTSTAWKSKDFARRVLGLQADVSVSHVISTISDLSVDPTLVSTLEIDQVIRMYKFLWEESQRLEACCDEIMKAFSCKMLLFVPAMTDSHESRNRFISVKNVVWSSSVHYDELIALETHYPKTLCGFFTEICGVQRKPSISFLCKVITKQAACMTGSSSSERSGHKNISLWKKRLLPLLCAVSKHVKKHSLSKVETKEIKKTLKSTPWLPARTLDGSRDGVVFCSSRDQPILAVTENEKKLQKLIFSIAKDVCAAHDLDVDKDQQVPEGGEDIKIVQLKVVEGDGDLNALLDFANIMTLSVHLEANVSSWCKAFVRFTKSFQLDSKRGKTKLLKLGQLLIKAWASASFSLSSSGEHEIQWSLQHAHIFPTIDDPHRWELASNIYINDQTELSEQDLQLLGQAGLAVFGLFAWNYFANISASKEENSEATRVHKFLTRFCGMKSLKEHLQYEVTVLSTQRPASEVFHLKIRTAFALAQRCLFHNHRQLYNQLHHDSIAKLASELQCVLVDGQDGFQVVYRVGSSFSVRREMNSLSRCFLDVQKNTLYLSFVTGDEEASALSVVLMELSRKLFGSQVAASVANVLYPSLMQPDTFLREQWLVETQLLPPLSASEAGSLWVDHCSSTCTLSGATGHKRALEDIEDGEIAAENGPVKKCFAVQQSYIEQQDTSLSSTSYTATDREKYDMQAQSLPYPPLPPQLANGNANGAQYHTPLSASSFSGPITQSLSLSNTMTKEERVAIGRWGEEYVFNQLKQQQADNESNLTVEWMNEMEESGLPYDLTLSAGNKVVEFIEVKSTRTMEKGVFEISMNELDQAATHGSTYCIYRVFNAGNSALCRVIRMKNPVSLVRQRKIQLALVMQ